MVIVAMLGKLGQLFFAVHVFGAIMQDVQGTQYDGRANSSLPFKCGYSNSCQNKPSCTTRLETQKGEIPPKCFCDAHCSSLSDCCADHVSSCQANNYTNDLKAQLTTDTWRCYQYSKTPRSPGIWMIASCPVNYTDQETRMKCEGAGDRPVTSSSVDFLSNIPTTHCYPSGDCVTFRNIYCARCNAVDSPIFWKLIWRCNISPPKHLNNAEKDKFLLENCPDFHLKPHPVTNRRYCFGVVSKCSVQVDSHIRDDCARGTVRLVYHPKTDRHYRNPSCLLCNGHKLDTAKCGPSEYSKQVFQPKSFEMVLQFESFPWNGALKSTRTTVESCGKELVYDAFLEECRVGVLPDPVQSIADKFRFKTWLKPRVSSGSMNVVDREAFKGAVMAKFALSSSSVSVFSLKEEENSVAAIFDIQASSTNKSLNATSSLYGLESLLHFESPFELTIQDEPWSVFKVTHKRMACSKPEIYPPGNFTRVGSKFIINNETLINASDGQVIAQNHTKQGIQAGSLFVCRSIFTEACNEGQVLLALRHTDYTLMNDSLLFKAASELYPIGTYALQGSNAWVCTNYTNSTKLENVWVGKWGNDEVLWYFTVCGLSFSIISLFFLLATYVAFRELRTLPGKNMMSLSVSLMLSEFIWLLGSGDTNNPELCKATAVALHYLFLVSFTCMTVIAYDTRRAFPKNNAQMSNSLFPSSSQRRLMTYLSFSWGLPFVFVVTCVVLDQQGAVAIGYGNAVICWLTDMTAQVIFFGVPLGIMLLYNLVAFIQTVQAIRVTKIGSKTLHRQGANYGNDIKIYFRLMTLMGFTWFFGFGAHALHKSLMYVFVLLTSLHGVYLALAFAIKPHVFNLYRNRLATLSVSRKTTISTIDLTTSMKSTASKSAESVL